MDRLWGSPWRRRALSRWPLPWSDGRHGMTLTGWNPKASMAAISLRSPGLGFALALEGTQVRLLSMPSLAHSSSRFAFVWAFWLVAAKSTRVKKNGSQFATHRSHLTLVKKDILPFQFLRVLEKWGTQKPWKMCRSTGLILFYYKKKRRYEKGVASTLLSFLFSYLFIW